MENKWFLRNKKADFFSLGQKFHIDPVITRIITNRGVEGEEAVNKYLNATLVDLYDPHLLKDANKGADLLIKKVKEKKKIRAITDYDIDGVQCSVIVKALLSNIGADFDCIIPHRIEDGYGISIDLIKDAIAAGVDTIITCDNGISAIKPIAYAKEHGLTVIVTDHHEMPYEMVEGEKKYIKTNADAVINPKQPDCTYPFEGLCGAAVIWKFSQVVYEKMGIDRTKSCDLLENVAFATIGDVMELVDENRIIVKYGLKCIRHSNSVGLNALIRECGIDNNTINSYHIGFILGPCINASGRLDTAKLSLELLEEKDEERAKELAKTLVELNNERKELTEKGIKEAEKYLVENNMLEDKVYVIYLPDIHESLNGIIAGKIKEKYYRPTFVLSNGEDCIKGSGRSIEGYSMYEKLVEVKELMLGFGGHPLAAGLSIANEETVDAFRKELNKKCQLSEEELVPKTYIDVPMPIDYINFNFIEQLDVLEPFGNGNKKPVFATKHLSIRSITLLGSNKSTIKMRVNDDNGYGLDAMMFHQADELKELITNAYGNEVWEAALKGNVADLFIDAVYYPSINEFRGTKKLQIILSEVRLNKSC